MAEDSEYRGIPIDEDMNQVFKETFGFTLTQIKSALRYRQHLTTNEINTPKQILRAAEERIGIISQFDKSELNLVFSNRQTAVKHMSQIIAEKGLDNVPPIKNKRAFTVFFGISKKFLSERKEVLDSARPCDLVDEAVCIVKGIDYISRDHYRNCNKKEEIYQLMLNRAKQLVMTGYFLTSSTRLSTEVSRVFIANYGISPNEIDRLLKALDGNSDSLTASTIEIRIAKLMNESYPDLIGNITYKLPPRRVKTRLQKSSNKKTQPTTEKSKKVYIARYNYQSAQSPQEIIDYLAGQARVLRVNNQFIKPDPNKLDDLYKSYNINYGKDPRDLEVLIKKKGWKVTAEFIIEEAYDESYRIQSLHLKKPKR